MRNMEKGMKRFLMAAVAALVFVTCNFETDGKFAGLVAGVRNRNALQAPYNVKVIADNNGDIRISWDGTDDADGYTVYRSPAGNTRFVRRGSSSAAAYTDSGASVPPDTPFYYRVSAYNSKEASKYSAAAGPVSAQRNAGILEAPEITAATVSGGAISISWTAVPDAAGYILYRASSFDGDIYIFRTTAESPSYTDVNLSNGSYSYQVRAHNVTSEGYVSLPWGPVTVTTGGVRPAPAKPQNLRAVRDASAGAGAAIVSWNVTANANSYAVYRSVDDELYEKIADTSSTTYQDTTVENGGAYYYRVRGYNGTQEGYLSDSCGPLLFPPGRPEISADVTGRTVTVTWDAVSGADTYYVYRSANNIQFQLLTGKSVRDLSYADTVPAGGTYYYRVEASNAAGKGSASESELVTVIIGAAVPVITVQPVGGAYLPNVPASPLTVTASVSDNGSLSYQWFKNADNANSGGTAIENATGSSYAPPTAAAGTLYYYVVVTNTNNSTNGNRTATAASNTATVTVLGGGQPEIVIPAGGTVIHISTQAGLESIRSHIDDPVFNYGKNAYVLDNDLTLSGTWTPIGYVETVDYAGQNPTGIHAFSGNFYGNGRTIRNLILPGGSIHYIGLFGYTDEALIDGLQVELGETAITVTNSSAHHIGIIAGVQKRSVIKNSSVYSSSGIVINGGSGRALNFGGISASNGDEAGIVENCYVSMNITATYGGTHLLIAGIAMSYSVTIKNCYYIGNITGTGGLANIHGVGCVQGYAQKSYSAGTITNNASDSFYTSTSGIAHEGPITNCATLIEEINLTYSTSHYGRIRDDYDITATLTNNYAYSGMRLNGSPVTSSAPNSQNGLDKTAAELKQRSTYETGLGWDFNNVWEMGPSAYPFPIFKWQNGVVKLPQGFKVIGERDTVALSASSAGEFATALSAVQNGQTDTNYVITVTADLNLAPQSLILAAYKDKTVTLKGNSLARAIDLSGQGSLFTIGEDVEFILENIVLRGHSGNNTSLVTVNPDGKLVLKSGGKVTGNTYTTAVRGSGGGGVFVDSGTLEIAGGEISGNNVIGSSNLTGGGGVYAINGSNVTMTSGIISDNRIDNVHSGNGDAFGGGIALYQNSHFEMSGGFIEANTVNDRSTSAMSAMQGGGVGSRDDNTSSFHFSGGTIRYNIGHSQSANSYGYSDGGGVCLEANFVMTGGVISGNSVTCSINPNNQYGTNGMHRNGAYGGGARSLLNGSITKTGGIIYGNEPALSGLLDDDGIPLANTAQSDGGGLGGGHAVFFDNGQGILQKLRRNSTAGETDDMDSSVTGSAGGWE